MMAAASSCRHIIGVGARWHRHQAYFERLPSALETRALRDAWPWPVKYILAAASCRERICGNIAAYYLLVCNTSTARNDGRHVMMAWAWWHRRACDKRWRHGREAG